MLKNIENEWYKIYKNKKLLILSLIVIFASLGFAAIVENIVASDMLDTESVKQLIGWHFPLQLLSVLSDIVFPIFATLLVATLVTDEISGGTLKLPLLCGQKRRDVILAKIVVVSIALLALMLLTFASSVLIAVLLWESQDVIMHLGVITIVYLSTYLSYIGWVVFSSLLALFIKSSGTLVGISTVLLVISSLVNGVFPKIARFQITYYFKAFSSGEAYDPLSFIICVITIVLFAAAAVLRFSRLQINK